MKLTPDNADYPDVPDPKTWGRHKRTPVPEHALEAVRKGRELAAKRAAQRPASEKVP